jgi:hypothetical protein
MYTADDDFASGFLPLIKSGTPTWPPIREEGPARAHEGAAKALANAAAWGPCKVI